VKIHKRHQDKMRSINARKPLFLSILIIVAIVPCVSAACSADEVTLGQVAKASKVYFRDSAELPLRMNVEMTITDQSGRIRKHKTGKVNYDFHGYNSRSEHMNLNLKGSKAVFKAAVSISMSSLVSVTLLGQEAEKYYTFRTSESGSPDLVLANMTPVPACDPFEWSADSYTSNPLCGSFEIQLRKTDFELKHVTFNASGLPVSAVIDVLGPVTILRFHSEADFQKVLIAGDPKPFLVPKLVTVIVDTDKGKIVMSSEYSLRKK
jgi:hypothetical protein